MASNQEGKQINQLSPGPKIPHSHFTLDKRFALTSRFGINTPIYAREFVTDDGPIEIEPSCDVRSYTLKAPMIGTIKKHVSFYQVPLQAILPFNWEKIVKNPNRGTDVVGDSSVEGLVPCLDGVNTVISNFAGRIYQAMVSDFNSLKQNYPGNIGSTEALGNYIKDVFTFVIKYEMFLSEGSLIAHFGAHFGAPLGFRVPSQRMDLSFDQFCEILLSNVSLQTFGLSTTDDSLPIGTGIPHVRRCLELIRVSGGFQITIGGAPSMEGFKPLSQIMNYFKYDVSTEETEPYNYGRCCAYQIVNAHFFTNDKIDYINTAELYRQYISSFVSSDLGFSDFLYNGIFVQYDFLSGFYIEQFLSNFLSPPDATSSLDYYSVISAIFGFNRSLRYMDYFVGARPKNLAVGDTSIRVDNNTVQVVDVTKNIVKQRFLNSIARIGNTIEEYSDKILGRRLEYDYHNPKFLFAFDADVFSTEVENTGEAQQTEANSVTAVLRGNFKNHRFTFSVDRYSYIIGIEYTDFPRFYFTTQDRATMAIDRFDMFVPELQYIGDQELRRSELLAGSEKELPFAYQLRDMQFKQSYDECCAGFVDYLPGWLFKFNPFERDFSSSGLASTNINPSFVRSLPSELDQFYLSLTQMNLAGYFHFIEVWNFKVSAKRPMAYAPQIL